MKINLSLIADKRYYGEVPARLRGAYRDVGAGQEGVGKGRLH
jgi:hypothetical protein